MGKCLTPEEAERMRLILHPQLPHVPQPILDGTATLKEFRLWARRTNLREDVMMGELAEVMRWINPFIHALMQDRG